MMGMTANMMANVGKDGKDDGKDGKDDGKYWEGRQR